MKKLIVLLFVVGTFTFNIPSIQAACVINGQYYSDTDDECIEWRGGSVAGDSSSRASATEIQELRRQISQLTQILQQLLILHGASGGTTVYVPPTQSTGGVSAVSVRTDRAFRIDDDRATLAGRLNIRNEDEATVYFQYGRSRSALTYETTHILLDDRDDMNFTQQIRNLRDDTTYYYRAVAEDERGKAAVGTIESFSTDDDARSSTDDEPDVTTDDADDIEATSALLLGEVDMNEFSNGVVFLVYGEDEDQVEDIADDYDEYDDVDEDGDDLRVVLLDRDLDDEAEYEVRVRGLDEDTDYYFTICVEYEDEDNDETITCGGVEEFTTDN